MSNILETVIKVTDGFSEGTEKFEKELKKALKPIDNINNGLKKIYHFSGLSKISKGMKDLKENASSAVQSFTNLGASIGIVFGAAGLSIKKLNELALRADEVGGSAERFGVDYDSFQKLRYASEIVGVSTEKMDSGLNKMLISASKVSNELNERIKYGYGNDYKNHPLSNEAELFRSLKISVNDDNGNLRKADDIIMDISERFSSAGYSSAQKLRIAQGIFGGSGSDLVDFLNEGPENLNELFEKKGRLGLFSKDDIEKAKVYNRKLRELKVTINSLFDKIGISSIDSLLKAVEAITWQLDFNNEKFQKSFKSIIDAVPSFVDSIVRALPTLMNALGLFLELLSNIIDKVGVALPLAVVSFGSVVVPLISTLGAVLKVGSGISKMLLTFGKVVGPRVVSVLSKLGFSSKVLGATLKSSFPEIVMMYAAFKIWEPTIKKVYDNLDMLSSVNFNDFVFVLKEIDGLFDGIRKKIADNPIFGPIANFLGSLTASKVDFSDVNNDSSLYTSAFNENELENSKLFKKESENTKNINNNIKQVTEFIFKGFPKDSIEIRQNKFKNELYGDMMSPAF